MIKVEEGCEYAGERYIACVRDNNIWNKCALYEGKDLESLEAFIKEHRNHE